MGCTLVWRAPHRYRLTVCSMGPQFPYLGSSELRGTLWRFRLLVWGLAWMLEVLLSQKLGTRKAETGGI